MNSLSTEMIRIGHILQGRYHGCFKETIYIQCRIWKIQHLKCFVYTLTTYIATDAHASKHSSSTFSTLLVENQEEKYT